MSLELDTRQEMTTASRTMGELAVVLRDGLLHAGLPESLVDDFMRDYWRIAVVPALAPNPLKDLGELMNGLFRKAQEDEEA